MGIREQLAAAFETVYRIVHIFSQLRVRPQLIARARSECQMVTKKMRRGAHSSLRDLQMRLTGYRDVKRKFHARLGYPLDLSHPRSFNEKVTWKKLFDRNPLLPVTADKYSVRDYVERAMQGSGLELALIPLLHVSSSGEDIPFDTLSPDYIVKSNHGSGSVVIVRDGRVDREEVTEWCKQWLRRPYGFQSGQWAYRRIPRKIVIEELLTDENGEVPNDIKFYMFHGQCRLIHVDHNRFRSHTRALYDQHWNFLPVANNSKPQGAPMDKPPELGRMLQVAERLAAGFDFVRVDLYLLNRQIYFGELTHYPVGGVGRFDPVEFDFELGAHWRLQPAYWKNR